MLCNAKCLWNKNMADLVPCLIHLDSARLHRSNVVFQHIRRALSLVIEGSLPKTVDISGKIEYLVTAISLIVLKCRRHS